LSNDIELLVNAIEGLHSNYFKDYILPIGAVCVSGVLGAGVAYYTVDKQEQTKIEIDKIKAINNTLLSAMQLRTSLISIKYNYFGLIDDEPIGRMLKTPRILLTDRNISIDLASISFIVPNKKEDEFNKWLAIDYISTIFSNYDTLLIIWEKRNQIIVELMPKLNKQFARPLNYTELQELIGVGRMAQLSDLTERCLHMTDDLLIEVSSFLIGFSHSVKPKLNKRILKKFGNMIQPNLPTFKDYPDAVNVISKVPSVNYSLLSLVQNRPEPDLKAKYRPIYQ
jgi:hypothetical protein